LIAIRRGKVRAGRRRRDGKMRRNDRCPGVPRSASPATIWQKIDKGVTCLLGVSCTVCRYFTDRVVRHLILGAGLALTFWIFWAFSALGQANAATTHDPPFTPASVRSVAAGTPALAHRLAHPPRPHHLRAHHPRTRGPRPRHPRVPRALLAATRRAAHPPRATALLHPVERLRPSGVAHPARPHRLSRLLAAVRVIEGRVNVETWPSGGRTAVGGTWSPYSGDRVDQGGDDSVRPTRRTRAPDGRSTANPPASRPRTPLGESPVYSAAQVGAVPRRVLMGGVIHLGHVLRVDRTAPGTPASVPAPGSSESDCSAKKTPSGASDLPWLSIPRPGLWSVAFQQTMRVGRPIADKPSFSPD
jgi:hypothetical protein